MEHEEVQGLLGAYALNAVDLDEAALLDVHIADCGECRIELDEHLEVVSLLSVTERSAPSTIWDSIADELRDSRVPAPDSAAIAPSADSDLRPATNVIPLRRRWLRPLAVAAAFVLLGGAAVIQSVRLTDANNDLADERATVSALSAQLAAPLDAAAASAMSDPTAQQVSLSSASAEANAVIVLMPDGTGYLAEHTLQPLSADRTYQLWAIVDGRVISAGVLGSDPGVVPFHIDPEGFEGFAITEEVIGGVEASENDPVVVGLAA